MGLYHVSLLSAQSACLFFVFTFPSLPSYHTQPLCQIFHGPPVPSPSMRAIPEWVMKILYVLWVCEKFTHRTACQWSTVELTFKDCKNLTCVKFWENCKKFYACKKLTCVLKYEKIVKNFILLKSERNLYIGWHAGCNEVQLELTFEDCENFTCVKIWEKIMHQTARRLQWSTSELTFEDYENFTCVKI